MAIKATLPRNKAKEAKARRIVEKAWQRKSETLGYRTAATKELCGKAMVELNQELFDGIQLHLNARNCKKSLSYQKRLVRKIIEKRMSQAVHQVMGHEYDYISKIQAKKYFSICMDAFATIAHVAHSQDKPMSSCLQG